MKKKNLPATHLLIVAPQTDTEKTQAEGFAISLGHCKDDNEAIQKGMQYVTHDGDVIVKILARARPEWEILKC